MHPVSNTWIFGSVSFTFLHQQTKCPKTVKKIQLLIWNILYYKLFQIERDFGENYYGKHSGRVLPMLTSKHKPDNEHLVLLLFSITSHTILCTWGAKLTVSIRDVPIKHFYPPESFNVQLQVKFDLTTAAVSDWIFMFQELFDLHVLLFIWPQDGAILTTTNEEEQQCRWHMLT